MMTAGLNAHRLTAIVIKTRLHQSITGPNPHAYRKLRHPYHSSLGRLEYLVDRVVHQQTTLNWNKGARDRIDVSNLAVLSANAKAGMIAISQLLWSGEGWENVRVRHRLT
jgi:hypothetical protein